MFSWLHRSLFRRLFVSYLFPIVIGFGVMAVLVSASTTNYMKQMTEREMLRQARIVNLAIQNTSASSPYLVEHLKFFSESFDKRILVFDTQGTVLATSMIDEVYTGKEIDRAIVDQIMQGQTVTRSYELEGQEHPVMSVLIPWGQENELYGGIVVDTPFTGVQASDLNIREMMLWALIIGSLISMVIVSYLSWSIARPLKKIEYASTEIALGHYDKRVEYPGTDEIGELTNAFNRMAEKLDSIESNRVANEQRRDDFIANISHELRTPLTSMQGFLEALQDGLIKDEESRKRYYDIMYKETIYLKRLVDDLMDLIKLNNRKVQLELYYIHVHEVIKKVMLTLEPKIKQRGNEIQLRYPDDPPQILADPIRLEQIFINILNNANKFTKDGLIQISIFYYSNQFKIQIKDTGMGIPSHDLNRIWDRFYKINHRDSREERGTGLGLAIVKELVELHHGKVKAESELGQGTTFTIILPIQKSP